MTKQEVAEFNRFPQVESWLKKFRSSTATNFGYALCRYFKWLRIVKKMDLTPNELLDLRDNAKNREEKRQHVQWALEHTRDNPDFKRYTIGRKYTIFQAIKNFYDYYETPLTTAKNVFGVRRKTSNNRKQISLAQAK